MGTYFHKNSPIAVAVAAPAATSLPSTIQNENVLAMIERRRIKLLPYEEEEIENVTNPDEIRCFGELSKEKIENYENNKDYNIVHDGKFLLHTNRETYTYKVFPKDHIKFTYEISGADDMILGSGVFGQVIKCTNMKTFKKCAIKIIRNKPQFEEPAKKEISILMKLNNGLTNKHVLNMIECFQYRGHIFIAFEVYYKNVYELIYAGRFKGFALDQCMNYAQQIIDGLNYIHNNNIVHCDLKPENLMFNNNKLETVIIIDFGLSYNETEMDILINERRKLDRSTSYLFYVQSRYYRAPETIMCLSKRRPIDIWSFGTILYEMLFGLPLFPAKKGNLMLGTIINTIGYPSDEFIQNNKLERVFKKSNPSYLAPTIDQYLNTLKKRNKALFMNKFALCNYLNIMKYCLEWDPDMRIKAHEALNYIGLINISVRNGSEFEYQFDINTRTIKLKMEV